MDMPSASQLITDTDPDPTETAEWVEALAAVLQSGGRERARFILSKLSPAAWEWGLQWRAARNTPYVNTIRAADEPAFPGGADALALERKLAGIMRWNALAMVVRAIAPMPNWAAISPAMPRRRTCSKSASTISSGPGTATSAATWCFSSRIRRPASMPALSWKARWTKPISAITGARSRRAGMARAACRPIRTRG